MATKIFLRNTTTANVFDVVAESTAIFGNFEFELDLSSMSGVTGLFAKNTTTLAGWTVTAPTSASSSLVVNGLGYVTGTTAVSLPIGTHTLGQITLTGITATGTLSLESWQIGATSNYAPTESVTVGPAITTPGITFGAPAVDAENHTASFDLKAFSNAAFGNFQLELDLLSGVGLTFTSELTAWTVNVKQTDATNNSWVINGLDIDSVGDTTPSPLSGNGLHVLGRVTLSGLTGDFDAGIVRIESWQMGADQGQDTTSGGGEDTTAGGGTHTPIIKLTGTPVGQPYAVEEFLDFVQDLPGYVPPGATYIASFIFEQTNKVHLFDTNGDGMPDVYRAKWFENGKEVIEDGTLEIDASTDSVSLSWTEDGEQQTETGRLALDANGDIVGLFMPREGTDIDTVGGGGYTPPATGSYMMGDPKTGVIIFMIDLPAGVTGKGTTGKVVIEADGGQYQQRVDISKLRLVQDNGYLELPVDTTQFPAGYIPNKIEVKISSGALAGVGEDLEFAWRIKFDTQGMPSLIDASTDTGGSEGEDNYTGGTGASDDWYDAGAGDDHLDGGEGDDFLFGNFGDDSIVGGAGNDILQGGVGNDTLDGGAGSNDIAQYGEYSAKEWDVERTADGTFKLTHVETGESDELTNIESIWFNDGQKNLAPSMQEAQDQWGMNNAHGTDYDDVIDADAMQTVNRTERDWINAGGGDDKVDGGAGGDEITGGEGNDTIDGGNNTAADRLAGTADAWQLENHASYSGPAKRYKVEAKTDDAAGKVTGTAGMAYYIITDERSGSPDGTDTVFNIDALQFSDKQVRLTPEIWVDREWVWNPQTGQSTQGDVRGVTVRGIDYDDRQGAIPDDTAMATLFAGSDRLEGNDGADALYGGAGGDTLRGDKGNDTLDGGANKVKSIDGTQTWDPNGRDGADVAEYNGKFERYTIARNENGSFTVTDSKSNGDGEDTLTNIEVVRFADGEKNLEVVSRPQQSWQWDPQTYQHTPTITGYEWEGTDWADTIDAAAAETAAGKTWDDRVRDGAGNDAILTGGGNDWIELSEGNDTVDAGSGNDTIRYDAAQRRFTVAFTEDSSGNRSFTVTDKLPLEFGGTGTDVLSNIENLEFSDGRKPLQVSFRNDGWQNSVDGTDFNDRVDTEVLAAQGAGGLALISGEAATASLTVDGLSLTEGNQYLAVFVRQGFDYSDNSVPTYQPITRWVWDPVTQNGRDVPVTILLTAQNGKLVGDYTLNNIYESNLSIQFYAADAQGAQTGNVLITKSVTLSTSRDWIRAGAGDDRVYSGAGGDQFEDDAGNDFYDGGANGSSTNDTWGNYDQVNFSGASKRYTITALTYNNLTAAAAKAESERSDAEKALVGVKTWIDARYTDSTTRPTDVLKVVDKLPADAGGQGVNFLVNMESIQFTDTRVELGVQIDRWFRPHGDTGDWVGNNNFRGGILNDVLDARSYDSDNTWSSKRDWMEGGVGNDSLYGGTGADQLQGGKGNDVIDGGDNPALDPQNPWSTHDKYDEARFTNSVKRYDIQFYRPKEGGGYNDMGVAQANGGYVKSGYYAADGFIVVQDRYSDALGGEGRDVVRNVERLTFSDAWEDLSFGYQDNSYLRTEWKSFEFGGTSKTYALKAGDFTAGKTITIVFNDWTRVTLQKNGSDVITQTDGNGSKTNYTGARYIEISTNELMNGQYTLNFTGDYNPWTEGFNIGSTVTNRWAGGTRFGDKMTGLTDGENRFDGRAGDDRLIGGNLRDELEGGAGDDTLDGGANPAVDPSRPWETWDKYDIARYNADRNEFKIQRLTDDASGSVTGTASQTYYQVKHLIPANLGGLGTDIVFNVERIEFSQSTGTDRDVQLDVKVESWSYTDYNTQQSVTSAHYFGTMFGDTITGGANQDQVEGNGGRDIIDTGAGDDQVRAGAGNDDITLGAGNDNANLGTGDDTVDGGSGFDNVYYDDAFDRYTVTVRDRASHAEIAHIELGTVETGTDVNGGGIYRSVLKADDGATVTYDASTMYIRVVDSLANAYGGEGIDTFYDVEMVAFEGGALFLAAPDMQQLVGGKDGDVFQGVTINAGDFGRKPNTIDDQMQGVNGTSGNDRIDRSSATAFSFGDPVSNLEGTYSINVYAKSSAAFSNFQLDFSMDVVATASFVSDGAIGSDWTVHLNGNQGDWSLVGLGLASASDAASAQLTADSPHLLGVLTLSTSAYNLADQVGYWQIGSAESQANTTPGGQSGDWLQGWAGNDTLLAGDGDDQLNGGLGNDLLIGGADNTSDRNSYWNAGDTAQYHGAVRERLVIESGYVNSTYAFSTTQDVTHATAAYRVTDIASLINKTQTSGAFDLASTNVNAAMGYGQDILVGIERINLDGTELQLTPLTNAWSWDGTWWEGYWDKNTNQWVNVEWRYPVSRSFITGTFFDDLLTGGTGGDEIDGQAGNDTIDGGADGSSVTATKYVNGDATTTTKTIQGNEWDMQDVVRYSGSRERYIVKGVLVNADNYSIVEPIFATGTELFGIQITDVLSLIDATQTNGTYDLSDANISATIGTGRDLLVNVERVEFNGSQLSIKPELHYQDDWSAPEVNGVRPKALNARGTDFSDALQGTAYSDWLYGNAGDDTLTGGVGGDELEGGAGDDVLIGGADSAPDQWGGVRKDTARYNAPIDRFTIDTVTIDSTSWLRVADNLPGDDASSLGVDLLSGVEQLAFSDRWVDVSVRTSFWNDWQGGRNYNHEGTVFGDNITGGTTTIDGVTTANRDFMRGDEGNDVLLGNGNGDELEGGVGNDVLDGGANGSSGESWRDQDQARFGSDSGQYDISRFTVTGSSAAGVLRIDGNQVATVTNGTLTFTDSALDANISDVIGRAHANLNLFDGDHASAWLVVDSLDADMGGEGADLLFNVENINFRNGPLEIDIRANVSDWDNNGTLDWASVWGTGNADTVSLAGIAEMTGKTVEQLSATRIDIELREGDDVYIGGDGGESIRTGMGNDYVDGGANSTTDQWGGQMRDEVRFEGRFSRYNLIDVTLNQAGTTWTLSNGKGLAVSGSAFTDVGTYSTLVLSDLNAAINTMIANAGTQTSINGWLVADRLPAEFEGSGVDALVNVEALSFNDKWMPLEMQVWYNRAWDEQYNDVPWEQRPIVSAGVDGTSIGDAIGYTINRMTGYNYTGDDNLRGNEGNDSINGGAGGDWIHGGEGDDSIDGGANGVDEFGNARYDTVQFDNDYDRYIITANANGSITVADTEADGDGTDTLINVESISFHDRWVRLGVETWVNRDQQTSQIWDIQVNGSMLSETIDVSGDEYQGVRHFIRGNEGLDSLVGGAGPDEFEGGTGDDTIVGGANGKDSWGNPGFDVARYEGSEDRYTLEYSSDGGVTWSSTNPGGADVLVKVTDSMADSDGGLGVDILSGIEAIAFWDRFFMLEATRNVQDLDGDGRPDSAELIGTDNPDTLTGDRTNDDLDGAKGNDTLIGGEGGDILRGGAGNDSLDGGADGTDREGRVLIDIARYDGNYADYTITATSGVAGGYTVTDSDTTTAGDGIDTLTNIEGIQFADQFISLSVEARRKDTDHDGVDDQVEIRGLDLASSGDNLAPTSGEEALSYRMMGGLGNDTLTGGTTKDMFEGGAGDDNITGGAGYDRARYSGNYAEYTITSPTVEGGSFTVTHTVTGGDGVDTLIAIEEMVFADRKYKVIATSGQTAAVTTLDVDTDGNRKEDTRYVTGTDNADTVVGASDLVNFLDGGLGADSLTGGSLGDQFTPGTGNDTLAGGANEGLDAAGNASMDRVLYTGNQATYTVKSKQKATFTLGGGIEVNDVLSVTVGSVTVSYTAASTTLATEAAAFAAAIQTAVDTATTVFTATADAQGVITLIGEDMIFAVDPTVTNGTQTVSGSFAVSSDANQSGSSLKVASASGLEVGMYVAYSVTSGSGESATTTNYGPYEITAISGTTLTLSTSLGASPAAGATLTVTQSNPDQNPTTVGAVTFDRWIEVAKGGETDTLRDIEQLVFGDAVTDLSFSSMQTASWGATGIVMVDNITGTTLADMIVSTTGDEVFSGGGGNDHFVFADDNGDDTISDFVAGSGGDVLSLLLGAGDTDGINGTGTDTLTEIKSKGTQQGDDTVFDLGQGNSITLIGVRLTDLVAANFEIVETF